jgi:hypothetical protein
MNKGRGRAQGTLALVGAAREILEEIQPATVRAVCYRLFVAGLIPSMETANTKRVSRVLVQAREEGELPWEWIVDETREAESVSTWDSPEQLFRACVRQYRRDYWSMQPDWVEVWSEKGTVRGTLAPVLNEYGVTFRVMHGFGSATVLNDVAEMTRHSDKPLTVLYVGDRDPSGMSMSERDLPTRLSRYGGNVGLFRVAIDERDTHESAGVPWFPAAEKTSDSRYWWYVERYGNQCWELDALSPVILRERVTAEIRRRLDLDAWHRAIEIEAAERSSVGAYLAAYPGISGPVLEQSRLQGRLTSPWKIGPTFAHFARQNE